MKFMIIRHADYENPGSISDWLESHNGTSFFVDTYNGVVPPPEAAMMYDGLILMGGPQSITDKPAYPELKHSFRSAEVFLKKSLPVIGVCLGSQILADIYGSEVRKGISEFGLYTVEPEGDFAARLPAEMPVIHWHSDTFDIPSEAERIFTAGQTPSQGFMSGSALALQFHAEITPALWQAWLHVIKRDNPQLLEKAPAAEEIPFDTLRENMFTLLDIFKEKNGF